jgi:hypothetical protein
MAKHREKPQNKESRAVLTINPFFSIIAEFQYVKWVSTRGHPPPPIMIPANPPE